MKPIRDNLLDPDNLNAISIYQVQFTQFFLYELFRWRQLDNTVILHKEKVIEHIRIVQTLSQ